MLTVDHTCDSCSTHIIGPIYCQKCVDEMIMNYINENKELYLKIKKLEEKCDYWETNYRLDV